MIVWLPALLILGFGALIAIVANHAVLERLQTFGIRETSQDSGGIDVV